MSVVVEDPDFTLWHGDALTVLRGLPAGSVDCAVTSPPYWGLRDYGTAEWAGGDPACDHKQGRDGSGRADGIVDDRAQRNRDGTAALTRKTCRCGAARVDAQLGLEETPEAYVAALVAVFREVRRVLADSGTLWLNLGDSYNNRAKVRETSHQPALNDFTDDVWADRAARGGVRMSLTSGGMKEKDLVGIPWRVAFALQADGWYLRSDIIWSKPNPMPESVTDRPTKAHEYVFLLSKSPRYFFDQEAVREPHSPDGRTKTVHDHATPRSHANYDNVGNGNERWPNGGRNLRSVWTIATQPYADAHFAVFPEELVRRCLLAGCPEGGTVLDPFGGSGTTALVAREHNRRAVLIELNETYCALAARRLQQLSLLA